MRRSLSISNSSPRRRIVKSAVFLLSLFGALGGAPSIHAQADQRVILCGYNVRNWLTMDRFDGRRTVAAAPKPESERKQVLATLLAIRPDILGVCEIGGETELREIQSRLKESGIDLPHSEIAHGGDEHRRLGLLSRFPIVARHSQTDLKYQLGASTLPFQRGILDVTVRVRPDFELRCLGVHLKSMREVTEGDQALMRRNEAHLLRRHLDAILNAAPQTRVVVYGDFNEHRNQPAIDEVLGSRASDAAMSEIPLRDVNGEVWTHFWDAADSYARLDYFFVSKALKPLIDPRRSFIYSQRTFLEASDHRPIVLSIRTSAPEK